MSKGDNVVFYKLITASICTLILFGCGERKTEVTQKSTLKNIDAMPQALKTQQQIVADQIEYLIALDESYKKSLSGTRDSAEKYEKYIEETKKLKEKLKGYQINDWTCVVDVTYDSSILKEGESNKCYSAVDQFRRVGYWFLVANGPSDKLYKGDKLKIRSGKLGAEGSGPFSYDGGGKGDYTVFIRDAVIEILK